jgi:hypothetical protein
MKLFLAGKTKVVSTHFDIWKTIRLGTVKNVEDFPKQMGAYKSNNPEILSSPAFMLASEEVEVDLVICTPFEFGFKDGATLRQMHTHALECGFQLCPAEVGPQLHIQWDNRVANECVVVGMATIFDQKNPRVLHVNTNFKGPYLASWNGSPDYIYEKDTKLVFVKPRK